MEFSYSDFTELSNDPFIHELIDLLLIIGRHFEYNDD